MIETVQKEIDGVLYEFAPLMATPARDMLDQLVSKFGPTAANAVDGLKTVRSFSLESDAMTEMVPAIAESLGGAIRGFSASITPGFHKQLVDLFLRQVSFRNEAGEMQGLTPSNREAMFATKLALETKILFFCLEAQYSDFFALLRRGLNYATLSLTKMEKGSSSPQGSNGSSGE